MERYRKLIPPLVGSLILTGIVTWQGISADKTVNPGEWVVLGTQLLMVASVWSAANVPGWERGKTWQAAIFSALAVLAAVITDGTGVGFELTGDEMLQLGVVLLSALGVEAVKQPLTRVPASGAREVAGGSPPSPPRSQRRYQGGGWADGI